MGGGPVRPQTAAMTAGASSASSRGATTATRQVEDDEVVTTQSSEGEPDTVQVHLRRMASSPPDTSSPGDGGDNSNNGHACELKYCKSAVYIHPSSYSRDNVAGWIAISKRGKRDFLLSWIPDSMLRSEDKDTFVKVEIGNDGDVEMGELCRCATNVYSS
jgi:hypothetical protein